MAESGSRFSILQGPLPLYCGLSNPGNALAANRRTEHRQRFPTVCLCRHGARAGARQLQCLDARFLIVAAHQMFCR